MWCLWVKLLPSDKLPGGCGAERNRLLPPRPDALSAARARNSRFPVAPSFHALPRMLRARGGAIKPKICAYPITCARMINSWSVEVDRDSTVRRGHEIAHEVSDHLQSSSLSLQHVLVHGEPAAAPRTTALPQATTLAQGQRAT